MALILFCFIFICYALIFFFLFSFFALFLCFCFVLLCFFVFFRGMETALFKVNLLQVLDTGSHAVLVLLDLSAAFDQINHSILLHQLEKVYSGCRLAGVGLIPQR